MDVFLFIATIHFMIDTAAIVCITCEHAQLKTLLIGIAFQPVGQTEAIFGSINETEHCKCAVQWYTIAALMLYNILLPINCYIGNSTSKSHSESYE